MKYMLLTYASQQEYDGMAGMSSDKPAWTVEQFNAMASFMTDYNAKLEESGELVETRGLAAPVHTRRIGGARGENVVTDGPYAETQEVLAGYWIIDCDGIDRATEIAAGLGDCPIPDFLEASAYVDVRPIDDTAPGPEH